MPMVGSFSTRLAATALTAALLLAGTAGSPAPSLQERLDGKLKPYLQHGCVLMSDDREILYRRGDLAPMIPASTLKMATALAALHYLGEDWHPKTEFYLSPDHDLIVRGYGDPFLVSEEWETIAAHLSRVEGLPRSLRGLRLDVSAFSPEIVIPGLKLLKNPSYALNGALAANFNTIHVSVKADGTVASAEPETPVTPSCRRLAAGLPPGNHRVNLSADPEAALIYAGELLQAFLEPRGYAFREGIYPGRVATGDRLIHTHRNSRSLMEILADMMLYSNNFTANQLLLVMGMEREGEPATLDKGLGLLREHLTGGLGIPRAMFHVVEGSGISRENLLHPEALINLARAFFPYRSLLATQDSVPLKTGTLRGVFTMAGILDADPPLFFAIMLNQEQNHRDRIFSVLLREIPRGRRTNAAGRAPSEPLPGRHEHRTGGDRNDG